MVDYKRVKNHFKKVDPVIHQVMQDLDFAVWLKPWVKKWRLSDYFRSLSRELISQQLSTKAADAIISRWEGLFADGKVSPHQALKIADAKLRSVGMSWGKVSYIKDLAEKFLDGSLKLNKLEQMADDEVIDHLTQVKGIGPWTSEMFLIFTLGREDVFSHGDLGLRKAIIKLYRLRRVSPTRIEKIIAPWSPYKSYGSIALWHSLEK
ncbi:MAG: HhH-GPD family protein [Candidatus Beckwithbacteria bacterium GW2011_GWB1_47_15]|uniref:DNA-3-methyladenine glycosylase II n=1 Tax=Candidatus Beckwithbacteria bacterium GW2011_GWB1_47_15 TaxID=1618371 RepID=A0A0G1U3W8_9BACT|nr:MAG: HhH-GPD family protein, DNA-3-methyladenine glycosylase II [Candidatus Beckwithbacteria bacterium GW2011_GWC1_49_16]KKU35774.1 MAG: HhH-GPD family protein [Candidatus Beckwithbacteria bacterium GW2011_GWA1_46_30]KKU61028.1 MAG: HhH-GPD family protein [Candidatus Beckwithbacteria bacterium GW2011_GWB1_47_15]KKU72333.1 MAG: HhH-GPD family protein [Candidatus Beckwithbacteria bacterium GW2011_GWA2_47_25]KKW04907.1 MAG: HhH-GPD family protein [Candidatus Beckwithbacteria bacterium GW2011_GW